MIYVPEAEAGAIGCCLLDPIRIDELSQALGPDSIVDIRIRLILDTLIKMREDGEAIDLITVFGRLRIDDNVKDVGGLSYLSEVCDSVPSAANLPYYTEQILEAEVARDTIKSFTEGIAKIQEGEATAIEILESCETRIAELREKHVKADGKTAKEIVEKVIDSCQEAYEGNSNVVPTGFHTLDSFLSGGGLAPKEFSVIAARPSQGKSVIGKDIALNIARNETPVGVFSLEDSAEGFMLRLISGWSKVPAALLKMGKGLTHEHFDRLKRFNAKIIQLPLHIEDESPMSVTTMVSKMAEMVRKHGVKVFIIDYLQYVSCPEQKPTRTQEVSIISKTLKSAAKRLNVHVLALAQLSREAENLNDGVAPSMHHLGESASIEQEADVILMIHKDKDARPNLHLAKQRNGPKFIDIPLVLHSDTVTFTER